MTGHIKIPKYTSKDIPILFGSMLPMSVLLNYFLYGSAYFKSLSIFAWTTLVSFAILGGAFLTYGFVAIFLRSRFPNDSQLLKRLAICISIFFLMSAVYISLILLGYDYFNFFGYEYRESDFTKAYISFITLNVFLTFLNEGVYRFEKYKATITETEQLKTEYMQSQLLGLKSQMNPHFLFNGLNTLSCLINEDPNKAEDFLNHMSKVYRYLLRNNEEQLVTLETELNFINSYYFLLKARYVDGLELKIDISEKYMDRLIPPLTLQMIVENSLNLNSVCRDTPLVITIQSAHEWLEIKNNIQPKINCADDCCDVLENINNKFRLLCQQEIVIDENSQERSIHLPMIPNKEMIVA